MALLIVAATSWPASLFYVGLDSTAPLAAKCRYERIGW